MSLILQDSEDFQIKSVPDYSGVEPQRTFVYLNHDDIFLDEALDEITEVLDTPILAEDEAISGLKTYLSALRLDRRHYGFGSLMDHALWFEPVMTDELNALMHTEDPGPELTFHGHIVSRRDFISLVHYVVTNTYVLGEHDPRFTFVEKMRQEST